MSAPVSIPDPFKHGAAYAPDDPVYRAVLDLRDGGFLSEAIAAAWTNYGLAAPRNLQTQIVHVHYKPFARARILIETTFERAHKPGKHTTQWLFLQIYNHVELAGKRLDAASKKSFLKCHGPPMFLLEQWNALAWALPNGPRLRPLRTFLRWRWFKRMLKRQDLAPQNFKLRQTRSQLIRYVPRRRALFRYVNEALGPEALYFKGYCPGEDVLAANNLRLLADAASRAELKFDVPALVRHIPQRRVIVMNELPGRSLTSLAPTAPAELFAELGRALASLHSSSIQPITAWSEDAEFNALLAAMDDVKRALPVLEAPIDDLLRELGFVMVSLRFECESVIHGNLFGDQILVENGRLGVVDWDDLRRGDCLYDLGRLIAHFAFLGISAKMSDVKLRLDIQAMLAEYEVERGKQIAPFRLRWHIAAALLFRAKISALRTLDAQWMPLTIGAVQHAGGVLAGSAGWLPASLRNRESA